MLVVGDGGVFVTGVLDMRHVVGMGCIFVRLLGVMALVVMLVLAFVVTLVWAMFGRQLRCADRCRGGRVGLRFRNRCFAGRMCVVVMTMRVVIVMMIVRMAVIVSVRLMVVRFVVVRLVVVMDGVGVMFAVVRLRFTGLHAFVPVRMVLSFV